MVRNIAKNLFYNETYLFRILMLLADIEIILECNIIVDFNDRNLGNQPYYYHTKPSSPTQGI